jgi:predicted AAA+ superfamily ATPase
MITKLLRSEIISDQSVTSTGKEWTKREIQIPSDTKRIIIVSGVRRCGKSTLIKQKLLNKKAIYQNFEDPRLIEFTVSDFTQLEKIASETGIKREINGIKIALAETGAREGYVITYNQEDNLEGIRLIPAWKWI